ncbi:MAG TPA: EAL domain-containing protein [Acidimicrobiia bacterium]|nr:EAL domain-containing protein [Acidimicrobiia bacterium]
MRSNGRLVAVVVGTVLTVSAAVLGGAGAFSTVPAVLVTLSLATVTVLVFGRGDGRRLATFASHRGALEGAAIHTSLAQLREAEQELAYRAGHDSLTGLANRARFSDRVAGAIEGCGDRGRCVSVLFIDLDDFKTVNDTMGHAAGDALLAEVARRIERCVGPDGTAARLGGDEFGVLLPGSGNEIGVRDLAARVLVALGDPIVLDGQAVVMQASIGVATHDWATHGWATHGSATPRSVTKDAADDAAAELMKHADVAMYTAKRNGKARFDEFEPAMSSSVVHRHRLKIGLERAIAADELVVHYQPVIDVATGELAALEALVRWQDPRRGLLPAGEFVGVAEETGLIVPIGERVLREACRQAAVWSSLKPDLRIFVNLSLRQFAGEHIITVVREALAESGLRPDRLQLEVTETAIMHDIARAAAVLHALEDVGVGIAIDDFGTGVSSLSYLRRLPVDAVKVGKPIVDAICESAADAAFVRGIVDLGHVVGLNVVAAGVEHVEQYRQLVDMGCDFVQGFYYAASMEPAAVAHLLQPCVAEPPQRWLSHARLPVGSAGD